VSNSTGSGGQELGRFLTELAACLDNADPHIAEAFAEHYGFEHAIDWVITLQEFHAQTLAAQHERTMSR
jgi:hypothetical protein